MSSSRNFGSRFGERNVFINSYIYKDPAALEDTDYITQRSFRNEVIPRDLLDVTRGLDGLQVST